MNSEEGDMSPELIAIASVGAALVGGATVLKQQSPGAPALPFAKGGLSGILALWRRWFA